MTKISEVTASLFRLPLDEILNDAMHGDHSHFELVTVTIKTECELEGTSYTYTGGYGGWLEVHSFPIDRYTTLPLQIKDHMAQAPNTPGIGVSFNWDMLNQYS